MQLLRGDGRKHLSDAFFFFFLFFCVFFISVLHFRARFRSHVVVRRRRRPEGKCLNKREVVFGFSVFGSRFLFFSDLVLFLIRFDSPRLDSTSAPSCWSIAFLFGLGPC